MGEQGGLSAGKMHADEFDIDLALIHGLLAHQFPKWADLGLEAVPASGTDNAIYRLGPDMALRLPRLPAAATQVDKEQVWLPKLTPLLPLAIPIPLAKGLPGNGYPWPWSVYRWLEGEIATVRHIADPSCAATQLGRFVAALQRIDPTGGPPPAANNSFRGAHLRSRDDETRAAIAMLEPTLDTDAAIAAWDAALQAPALTGPPVWVHGDLHAGNLLARHGQLSAVIDFGCLGVGDPACDVMAAWTYLSAETRDAFKAEVSVDPATWARARGWALSFGLVALPYYQLTNPALADTARHAIKEALADHVAP